MPPRPRAGSHTNTLLLSAIISNPLMCTTLSRVTKLNLVNTLPKRLMTKMIVPAFSCLKVVWWVKGWLWLVLLKHTQCHHHYFDWHCWHPFLVSLILFLILSSLMSSSLIYPLLWFRLPGWSFFPSPGIACAGRTGPIHTLFCNIPGVSVTGWVRLRTHDE